MYGTFIWTSARKSNQYIKPMIILDFWFRMGQDVLKWKKERGLFERKMSNYKFNVWGYGKNKIMQRLNKWRLPKYKPMTWLPSSPSPPSSPQAWHFDSQLRSMGPYVLIEFFDECPVLSPNWLFVCIHNLKRTCWSVTDCNSLSSTVLENLFGGRIFFFPGWKSWQSSDLSVTSQVRSSTFT